MPETRESSTKESGLVTEIIYQNRDNGYTVCIVDTSEEEIVVVGNLPMVSAGEKAVFEGRWTYHPTHGPQFKADSYECILPKTRADILRYLSSGIIKGIRAATAQKIVDRFGDETLDILSSSPEKLSEIKGISLQKAQAIGESYAAQTGVRDVLIFLQRYSISAHTAYSIYKKYGLSSIPVIKHNPYILAEEVHGIGFRTADAIALGMGYDKNSFYRIRAGLTYVLNEAASNGHTNLPADILINDGCKLLEIPRDSIEPTVTHMCLQGDLTSDKREGKEYIYIPAFFHAELSAARLLDRMSKYEYGTISDKKVDKLIKLSEQERGITLDPRQRSAVMTAAKNGVCVITGGPGTGKTTIIKTIISVMGSLNLEIRLAAPTGRAAKRMSDMCGCPALTVHRLLEYNAAPDSDKQRFIRCEDNPIQGDVIIVDEMSMVDTMLFSSLLKALSPGTRLILVGDADQLPSVGAGNVLNDIINSGCVPVVKLETIFRQHEQSTIVVNAHRINKGEYPITDNKSSDFFFLQRESAADIINTVTSLCLSRLPKAYGYDPLTDIQVLTPMRRSAVGVNIFNEKLQQILNPPVKGQPQIVRGHTVFRPGDKVMQIKNNYDIVWNLKNDPSVSGSGVFNGDVGYITEFDRENGEIKVLYDDERVVVYDAMNSEELELAYAMTIHKSQGSEFKAVIIPMYPSAPMLQNRNLLYTAVTRAKEMVILVGREYIIKTMVDNISEQKRYSGLRRRLEELKQSGGMVNEHFQRC